MLGFVQFDKQTILRYNATRNDKTKATGCSAVGSARRLGR